MEKAKAMAEARPGRLNVFRRIAQFFLDAWSELNKVAWPTFVEVRKFTLVVLFAVIAVALFIHLCDVLLSSVTKPLFEH